MAILILAAFILFPLAEVAVFIEVGGEIGALPTVVACVVTAVIGSFLLRVQGLATLGRVREQMDRGIPPARELFDGALLLLAGALLLVPGFVTDAIGFLLFLPPLRGYLFAQVTKHAEVRYHAAMAGTRQRRGAGGQGRGPIIDADYEDLSESPAEPEAPNDGPRRLPE